MPAGRPLPIVSHPVPPFLSTAACPLPVANAYLPITSGEANLSPGLQHLQCCVSCLQSIHTLVSVQTWQDSRGALPGSATPMRYTYS